MSTEHRIIVGDSRKMTEVEDNSVHLIVTSPPYWQLKDYDSDDQIGFDDSYEDYINNLDLVWNESFRVLKDGCRLCINIGDQFARAVYYGRYKIIPIRTEIIKFCESRGFDYMGAIIWQKKTTMNTTGGATVMGSYPYPRNGILELDYEFILIFKKPGSPPKVDRQTKEMAKLSKEEWREYFSGHWYFGGEKQKKHIAMFPEELPKRLIRMFTFPGETVADPFLGSGTTALAAINLGRNSVGYEINKEFLPVIKEKIGYGKEKGKIEVIEREQGRIDYAEDLKKLPYVFKDPVKLNKKIDPRKLKFGSRITQEGNIKREEHLKVEEVLSPEVLKLSNGITVRLLGVREIPAKRKEAIEFLKIKTSKSPVFLKFDSGKFDGDGNLRAYLYLKNKTFVNAHLIKRGLAGVDRNDSFKYRTKFLTYVS